MFEAFSLALASAGNGSAASKPIMAMTTNNSINVNAQRLAPRVAGSQAWNPPHNLRLNGRAVSCQTGDSVNQ